MKKISFLPNRGARLGHQFAEWLIGYIYCKNNNVEFYHHDFICNSKELDIFLNLHQGEYNIKDYEGRIITDKEMDLNQYMSSELEDLYLYDFFVFEELNNNVRLYLDNVSSDIRNILRNKYFYDKENKIEDVISVHIRRNDVKKDNFWKDRYISIDYYINILNELYREYPNFHVKIFSHDVDEDFFKIKEISFKNLSFHIDEDLKDTIHSLITSKIMVASSSGLSFLSTLISDYNNIKICPDNFWHGWPEEVIKRNVR